MKQFNSYTDIASLQDACEHQGLDYEKIIAELHNQYSAFPEDLRSTLAADGEMLIVAKSINMLDGNYVPNWNDYNEYKRFPWFIVEASDEKPSGFGFSNTYCVNTYAHADLGSRLMFRDPKVALYVANTFQDIYKRKFLILD